MAQRPGSITHRSGYVSITPNDQSSDRLLDEGFRNHARAGGHCQVDRCRGYIIALTEADGDFVTGLAHEDLDKATAGASNVAERRPSGAESVASSHRDLWIEDCDSLGLSLDKERGINHLAKLEFIVIQGSSQCGCAYDHIQSQYAPMQPPLLSGVHEQSLQVGLNIERWNSETVIVQDASGGSRFDIPYLGHVDDLLAARDTCAAR